MFLSLKLAQIYITIYYFWIFKMNFLIIFDSCRFKTIIIIHMYIQCTCVHVTYSIWFCKYSRDGWDCWSSVYFLEINRSKSFTPNIDGTPVAQNLPNSNSINCTSLCYLFESFVYIGEILDHLVSSYRWHHHWHLENFGVENFHNHFKTTELFFHPPLYFFVVNFLWRRNSTTDFL